MLADRVSDCADPTCGFDIEPGDIVENIDGEIVHEGCVPG